RFGHSEAVHRRAPHRESARSADRETAVLSVRPTARSLEERLAGPRGNAGELSRQRHVRARVVGAREPLLVRRQAPHVVHLEEELPGAEGITGILPGQLEQTKALGRALVAGDEVTTHGRTGLGIVEVGLARSHEETGAAELADMLQHGRVTLDRERATR